jgi:RNA polymerase sigma-70 factor (ECF subfamily)
VTEERSDEELLRRVVARDMEALEALYDRYGSAAYSLALRLTGSRETAEDVVQESFLSAWKRADTYRSDRGSARTWLLGITHHRAVDNLRARMARAPMTPLDDDLQLAADDDIWSEVELRLDRQAIVTALDGLPAEQRESIRLAYFGGLSYPEIAQRLSVPLGTVKSRMRLGIEKLRTLMANPYLAEPESR